MRVWRFILWGCIGCTLLIGAALSIGHLLPLPAESSALARNSCALPCFFGVAPGETTYTDTVTILSKRFRVSQDSPALISFPLLDGAGRTSLASINFDGNGVIASVRLIPIDANAITGQLGDLLASGQRPTHLYHTCTYQTPIRFLLTFGAQNELVVEAFPSGDLAAESRLTLIDLSTAQSRSLYDATSSFGCTVESDWRGLAPLWKYFLLDKPPV